MDNQQLSDAIGEIKDDFAENAYIEKRKPANRKRGILIAAGIAAAVFAVIGISKLIDVPNKPNTVISQQSETQASDTAEPASTTLPVSEEPSLTAPEPTDLKYELISPAYPAEVNSIIDWKSSNKDRFNNLPLDSLTFTEQTIPLFLGSDSENAVFSPFSLYLSLASLAEISEGETRAQVLALLGAPSVEELRATVKSMWLNAYCNGKYFGHDEEEATQLCIPSNSFWLNSSHDISGDTAIANILKNDYFTSFFKGDPLDDNYQNAYRNWLNNATGGLLKDKVEEMRIYPSDVFSMINTLYLNAEWMEEFHEVDNTQDTFYGASGETETTFMHKACYYSSYYKGDGFSAYPLHTKSNASVWFVLPDESKSLREIIDSGAYLSLICAIHSGSADAFQAVPEGYDGYQINLSLPKFDIAGNYDLKNQLRSLGVINAFDMEKAEIPFIKSPSGNLCITGATQNTRLQINEKGISAASITNMSGGWGAPVFYEVDFNLNRPFLTLVCTDSNTPLFAAAIRSLSD